MVSVWEKFHDKTESNFDKLLYNWVTFHICIELAWIWYNKVWILDTATNLTDLFAKYKKMNKGTLGQHVTLNYITFSMYALM